ncbi:SIS domain-containing protein [Microbulbifer sp. 2205BS26-8]|uniref:SIS domain-containing protein n=1 Tax=Microbulbifer sp. 2205BS26-8 TaxID=3064386 RepID=UPI00273E3215|nr:SIS domain-containing protein [Microbulbifer sp. 2205BS26-8]MDP5210603.1 SIS domain-containing protein [Microbulbifer sp. 2205BS26-8]
MYENLAINKAKLRTQNGEHTAREIAQQPDVWLGTAQLVQQQRGELDSWLKPLLERRDLRIILTGAGTSAYVGETLAPYLTRVMERRVEAISTTDLVSNPQDYLLRQQPTLLISYARSGNSPESVGAYDLADRCVDDCYHLVITCNRDGELAARARSGDNSYSLLMLAETLDQSFAMTSSFTAMLVGTLEVFAPGTGQVEILAGNTRTLLETRLDIVRVLAQRDFRRVVFLGSGGLRGIATEAALKMLELTAGKVDCNAESPLGFRHGPKSMLNKSTLVLLLQSNDSYCRGYDDDLLEELRRDGTTEWISCPADLVDTCGLKDAWLALYYIVFAQLLAFYKSLALGITPDNPCPTGEVNRVVQGVTIHPFTTGNRR